MEKLVTNILLKTGDIVLADRVFNIKDSLSHYGTQLKIPDFKKGKSLFPKEDVNKTRQLASVRIHVEKLIGLTRQ